MFAAPLHLHCRASHSDAQIDQIAANVRAFGFTNPILADERGVVIAGHGRLAAAERLGMDRVPVIRVVGLSDAQRRSLTLADNRVALNSSWNEKLLAEELRAIGEAIDAGEFDLDVNLGDLGFGDAELEEYAALLAPEAEPEPARARRGGIASRPPSCATARSTPNSPPGSGSGTRIRRRSASPSPLPNKPTRAARPSRSPGAPSLPRRAASTSTRAGPSSSSRRRSASRSSGRRRRPRSSTGPRTLGLVQTLARDFRDGLLGFADKYHAEMATELGVDAFELYRILDVYMRRHCEKTIERIKTERLT